MTEEARKLAQVSEASKVTEKQVAGPRPGSAASGETEDDFEEMTQAMDHMRKTRS